MRFLRTLALLLLLPTALFAQEESGATFLERTLESNLSGAGRDVRVTGFRGALSSTATMERLTIADDQGIWLTLEGVTLDWSRTALLRGRLSVQTLSADRIDLARLPTGEAGADAPSPEASGFRLPELPISVNIGRIASPNITIGEPVFGLASSFSLEGSLSLEGGEGTGSIDITRLDGPQGIFAIDAAFSNATGILTLDAALTEAPGGIVATLAGLPGEPSVDLDVTGQGPLTNFEATLSLATNGEPRLSGNLAIGGDGLAAGDPRPFRAQLSGDVAPLLAPDYRDFFGSSIALDVAGTRGADGALDLDTFRLTSSAISLDGTLALAAGGTPRRFNLDGTIADPDGSPVLLPIPGAETRVNGVTLTASFDAASGNAWQGLFRIDGLDRPGFSAEQVTLDGGGTINPGAFTVDLDFTAEALDLADTAAVTALGERVTGRIVLGSEEGQPLQIGRFDLNGETYALESSGTLDIADRDLAIAGRARVSASDLSVFAGLANRPLRGAADLTLSGSGSLLAGTFDVQVDGRTTDLAVGIPQVDNIVPGTTQLSIGAARDVDGITLRTFRLGSPVARVSAEGVIRTAGTRLSLSAALDDGTLVLPGLTGAHTLSLDAEGDGEAWTIRSALTGPTLSGAVDGRVADLETAPAFDGTVTLNAASLTPLAELAGLPDLRGATTLSLAGNITSDLSSFDVRVSGTGTDVATGLPALDPLLGGDVALTLDASRPEGGAIAIRTLSASTATLSLDGAGTLTGLPTTLVPPPPGLLDANPAPAFVGRLSLRATDLSPAADLVGIPALAGSVTAELQGNARADLSGFDIRLTLEQDGLSLGRPDLDRIFARDLSVTLDAARQDDGPLTLRTLSLTSPDLSASMQGTVTGLPADLRTIDAAALAAASVDARFTLDAQDLVSLGPATGFPGLTGKVQATASGTAAADLSRFDLSLDVAEQGLTLGRPDLDPLLSGGLTATLRAARDAGGDVRITALSVRTPTIALSAEGAVTGLPAALVPPPADLSRAAFDGRVTLDATNLAPAGPLARLPGLGGALRASLDGRVGLDGNRFDIRLNANGTNFRTGIAAADAYLAGNTVLAIDATRDGPNYTIRRADFTAPGLTASAEGFHTATTGSLTGELRLDNLGRIVEGFSGPATVKFKASGSGPSAPWAVQATAEAPGGVTLRADGTAARGLDRVDLKVQGEVPLGLANSFIQPRSVSGRAKLDLRVSGPPALSSVSGRITSTDTRYVDPDLGVVLENVSSTIDLSGGRAQLDVTAPVQGGGRILVSGPVGLTRPYSGDLRVTFDNARVRDPALYDTTVSGTITLSGPLTGGANIAGRLALGQTEIRIPSSITGGTAPIPNITHIAESRPVRDTLIRAGLLGADGRAPGADNRRGPVYGLDVRIDALNEIFIRGRGLDAELGGSLRIGGTTANVIPSGQFELIRGRLDILGRRLTLDQGSITMQGSLDPFLFLSASSSANGITARVVLAGNLSDPQLRFESTPELPEDEVVAQLLFGRGIKEISPFQAAQLASSIATLTGRGGEGILGSLRRSFGLDDLDIGTTDAGDTELTLGTYLTDNIYTDVVVSDGRTELDINLELTPSITVTGSTADDGDSSIGIRFERDF
jgi:translocation and assembly module TamB